jgi:hypothetical protein
LTYTPPNDAVLRENADKLVASAPPPLTYETPPRSAAFPVALRWTIW